MFFKNTALILALAIGLPLAALGLGEIDQRWGLSLLYLLPLGLGFVIGKTANFQWWKVTLGLLAGAIPIYLLSFTNVILVSFEYKIIWQVLWTFGLLPVWLGWLLGNEKRVGIWGWLGLGMVFLIQNTSPFGIGELEFRYVGCALSMGLLAYLGRGSSPWRHLAVLGPWALMESFMLFFSGDFVAQGVGIYGLLVPLAVYAAVTALPSQRLRLAGVVGTTFLAAVFAYGAIPGIMFQSSYEQARDLSIPFNLFQSVNQDGTPASQFDDKVVYVDVWSTRCGACVAMYPEIEKLHSQYKNHPQVRVVGIVPEEMDPLERVSAFADRNELDFPILLDTTGFLVEKFSLEGVPLSFIATPDGKVLDVHPGFSEIYAEEYWARTREQLQRLGG